MHADVARGVVLQVEEVIMASAGQFVPASAYPSMEGATGRDLIALAGSPTLAPQVRSWPHHAPGVVYNAQMQFILHPRYGCG